MKFLLILINEKTPPGLLSGVSVFCRAWFIRHQLFNWRRFWPFYTRAASPGKSIRHVVVSALFPRFCFKFRAPGFTNAGQVGRRLHWTRRATNISFILIISWSEDRASPPSFCRKTLKHLRWADRPLQSLLHPPYRNSSDWYGRDSQERACRDQPHPQWYGP